MSQSLQPDLEVRVLSATSVCGAGFKESSLAAGMLRRPHFIGCDAGSTDPGPAPLGTGTPAFPRRAVKRDLRLMMKAGLQGGIPLLIGSAGTAGGEPHLRSCGTSFSKSRARRGCASASR